MFHVHCESLFQSPPLTKPQNISIYDEYHNRSEKHYTEDYNWFAIYETNKAIHQIWKARYPQVLYLNVYSSTVLRADSHKIVYRAFNWSHPKVGDAPYYTPTLKPQPDCLHYCIPGPVNQWVRFFYDSLVTIERYHQKRASGSSQLEASDETSFDHDASRANSMNSAVLFPIDSNVIKDYRDFFFSILFE